MHLDVRAIASPFGFSRIGIVVPLHGRTAVARNRLKRRLRELVRLDLLPALEDASAVDVAIRARPEAYGVDFDALAADIRTAAGRLSNGAPKRETKA